MPTADNSERNATSTTPVTPVHRNYGAHGFQNDYQITTEGRVTQLYYDTWLQGFNANPLYAAAYAKYGDKFKRIIFDAEQHNQDENVVIQRLLNEGITFAGLKIKTPGGGGPRGGGGGGIWSFPVHEKRRNTVGHGLEWLWPVWQWHDWHH